MPLTQDDIGIWQDLGTITPTYNQWIKFPASATEGNSTFRISFIGDAGIRNKIWLRAMTRTGNLLIPHQLITLYPYTPIQIFQYPLPQDLELRNNIFRDFEINKQIRAILHTSVNAGSYTVKLEELT